MPNSLTFVRPHKSITGLEAVTLPDFVVLTGVNGSGKTHLLAAIKGGQVSSSLVNDLQQDVRLFDSTSIVPKDTGVFDPAQDQMRRSGWFQNVQSVREQHLVGMQNAAMNLGVPAKLCLSIGKIAALDVEALTKHLSDPQQAETVHSQLREQIRATSQAVANQSIANVGDDFWRKHAPRVAAESPESFLLLSRSDFFRNNHLLWEDVDPFQQAFAQVFVTYRAMIHENHLLEKYAPPGGLHKPFLSDTEFIAEFGEAPWDFVNRILEISNLDFRVDSPPLHETAPYEPKLRKLSRDVEMRFEDLSSGEKVLMSFALCLYNSEERRQAKHFPRLLLFDEVDAPLHPSMAASLLNTVKDVLVKGKGVAVIMTTHSPSTVALAPEDAIYQMDPAGPRLKKISKGAALGLLTAGVPTLSVSFDGRRQVFVESKTDASLYDRLYQKYKSDLASERSLVFIPVGGADDTGQEHASGCDQVIRVVRTLATGGNQSVFGLIDWDGEKNGDSRLVVLAHSVRDGLESLLFDPLLLVALVARVNIAFAHANLLLAAQEQYIGLEHWNAERWQIAVDRLQEIVLECPASDIYAFTTVNYASKISLQIRNDYLHKDDHELEAAIVKKFGFLKPHNNRAGALMQYVIDTVLGDFSSFVPLDLLDTFGQLLTNPTDLPKTQGVN